MRRSAAMNIRTKSRSRQNRRGTNGYAKRDAAKRRRIVSSVPREIRPNTSWLHARSRAISTIANAGNHRRNFPWSVAMSRNLEARVRRSWWAGAPGIRRNRSANSARPATRNGIPRTSEFGKWVGFRRRSTPAKTRRNPARTDAVVWRRRKASASERFIAGASRYGGRVYK